MVANGKPIDRECRDLGVAIGWVHPSFLPAGLAISRYLTDEATPTASIDLSGVVRIGPQFWNQLTLGQKKFVLAHEWFHPILRHHERQGSRDRDLWNVAADMALNQFLLECQFELLTGAFLPPTGLERATAEAIYDALKQDATKRPQGAGQGAGQGAPTPGQGCAALPAPKGPEGAGTDAGAGGEGTSDAAIAQKWREVAAQVKALSIGTGEGAALARILNIPAPTVRWRQFLRATLSRAVATHGYDDVSYARRGRRSEIDGPQFPGGICTTCRVAVVIDTSGSVFSYPGALDQALAETVALLRTAGVPGYLVVHDDGVRWAGWIKPTTPAPKVARHLIGGGGTSFGAAYHAVEKAGAFDVMVHLTDGEVWTWPARPRKTRKLVVGLLGGKDRQRIPEQAKVVEVQL